MIRASLVSVALLAGCDCPHARDQVVYTVEVAHHSALGLTCSGGCGATLFVRLHYEGAEAPSDAETIQVAYTDPTENDTATLVFAWDVNLGEIGEGGDAPYTHATVDLQLADPTNRTALLMDGTGPVTVSRNEDPESSGSQCGIQEFGAFAHSFDANEAQIVDPGTDSGG